MTITVLCSDAFEAMSQPVPGVKSLWRFEDLEHELAFTHGNFQWYVFVFTSFFELIADKSL